MNLFFLDSDHKKNAEYHVDKHVVKMRLEIAQLCCTAHHVLESQIEIPYKPTHKNHPCAIWVRNSVENYNYAIQLGLALCDEMRHRFNTPYQKCEEVLLFLKANPIIPIPSEHPSRFSKPAICIEGGGVYVHNSELYTPMEHVILNYREYYRRDKTHLFKWSNREKPEWL